MTAALSLADLIGRRLTVNVAGPSSAVWTIDTYRAGVLSIRSEHGKTDAVPWRTFMDWHVQGLIRLLD